MTVSAVPRVDLERSHTADIFFLFIIFKSSDYLLTMSSNSALLTLWRVSPALAKVIKADTVTRAQAVKGIWAHIK